MIEFHGNIETVEFANWVLGRDDFGDVLDRARAEAAKEALRQEFEESDSELFLSEALAYELEDLFNLEFSNIFGSSSDDTGGCDEPYFAGLAARAADNISFRQAAELVYEEHLSQVTAALRLLDDILPFRHAA